MQIYEKVVSQNGTSAKKIAYNCVLPIAYAYFCLTINLYQYIGI